ncbi:MAG: hypothetical protein ACJ8J0_21995 [Longimicrobiaceae bacterium]
MRTIRASSLLLASALLAACADRTPVAPDPVSPVGPTSPAAQRIDCTARVQERTVTCGGTPSSLRANIYGGQGVFVKLTTTAVSFDAGTGTFSATETVQNLLPYPLGVHAGVAADSGGVKVFFQSGPTATAGSGSVTVQNPDGVGAFTATGQPFFKYAQVLAPQEVSAPRTWLFHLDPGVTAFSFSVYVAAEQQPSAFRIVTPLSTDTVPADSIAVEVIANAPPAPNFVRASFPSRPAVFLTYTGNNHWSGKVSTLALPPEASTLRIVAVAPTDSLVQTVALINPNTPPVLTLTEPKLGTVVRDTTALRVAGTCATSVPANACTVSARVGTGPVVSVSGPAFDFTVQVPYASGNSPVLLVTATDSRSHSTSVQRTVIVETSPYWHEVASAGSRIEAGSPQFLLYSDSSAVTGVRALRLRDLAGGTEVEVRANIAKRTIKFARTTTNGAVFAFGLGGAAGDSLFEVRNGVTGLVGLFRGDDWHVNGQWVTWVTTGATLFVRDVVAGATTQVATNATLPNVGPNGDVAFVQGNPLLVKRWRAGTITTIGPGYDPKTDGHLIVYANGYLRLYDETTDVVLSAQSNREGYDVRNGWVLYTTKGTNGGLQLYSRAPDGTQRAVSTEVTGYDLLTHVGFPFVHAVGDNGAVTYDQQEMSNAGTTYSAPPYTTRTVVGQRWARERFFGSTPYIALGRSFYVITP